MRAGLAEFRTKSNKPLNLNFFCHAVPTEDVAREQAWLKRLATYYTEFKAETPALPLKAGLQPIGEETCALVEDLRPAVASFHLGLPAQELLARVKSAGCKVIASATSVKEAIWLAKRGVDAVIAQGAEAGGHRSMFLETDVADRHLRTGAAGRGCRTGSGHCRRRHARGTAAAFALGAAGVQIGTAYLRCPRGAYI
jgi:nitronate monooxygenase